MGFDNLNTSELGMCLALSGILDARAAEDASEHNCHHFLSAGLARLSKKRWFSRTEQIC